MAVLRNLLIASLFAAGSAASATDNSDIQAELDALTAENTVIAGAYLNKLQDVDFKDGKFTIDFYIWFRWKPLGNLAEYKPLESIELINGRVESKANVVEKTIGGENYASARFTATIYKNWGLKTFPFDAHKVGVVLEDSEFNSRMLRFEPDLANSLKGDEISLPGWEFSGFGSHEALHTYLTNYGDTSDSNLRAGGESYSRLSFDMDMRRSGWGTPFKLLSTALIAAFVAFIAFGIRPGNVDPRFGLGIGALFAVTANSVVVAELVPTSGLLTIADQVHLVTAWFILASLVQSAFCLKWDEAGETGKWKRADFWSRIVFPLLFVASVCWLISTAFTRGVAD